MGVNNAQRVQWTVSVPAMEWFKECSRILGTSPSKLADRMIRYHAGQLPEDEFDAFEAFMGEVGEHVADSIDWGSE